MKSLGKKISCPKCKTKLFTFQKDNFTCPVCKKAIQVSKEVHHKDLIEDDQSEEDISDDDLINQVIPAQYYMEIEEILDSMDASNPVINPHDDDDETNDFEML